MLPPNKASLGSGSGQMPQKDGTFRPRDRNIDPKEFSTAKLGVAREWVPRNLIRDEVEEDTHYNHCFKNVGLLFRLLRPRWWWKLISLICSKQSTVRFKWFIVFGCFVGVSVQSVQQQNHQLLFNASSWICSVWMFFGSQFLTFSNNQSSCFFNFRLFGGKRSFSKAY